MRVAVVTPRYPPASSGGGEQSAKLLATHLTDRERIEEVIVFAFDGSGTATREGVEIRRLGEVSPFVTEAQNLTVVRKLRGRLSAFDVVHAYNMELHPAVGYLSDREGFASAATLNSYHFFRGSVTNTTTEGLEQLYELVGLPTTGRLLRRAMKRIDAFVALSRAIQDIYRANGFADERIEHVPNMVDSDFEVPAGSDSKGRQLLYVGTLTENKGVRYLVEALSQLPEEYRLRVVGEGDRSDALRDRTAELGVDDRTEFSGWVPYERIGEVYADADVFVHPGIWPEPLNRTVLEAMQAGIPVVCTDVGGPPEVVPDEELLCEPGDPEALAAAIHRTHDVDGDVGERNRRYVLENHAPSVVVPRLVDLDEDLLGG